MGSDTETLENFTNQEYKYGFTTDIESDSLPPGLDEEVVKHISKKKNEPEFMLEWRLDAYKKWQTMKEPTWAFINYPKIDLSRCYLLFSTKEKTRIKKFR